MDSESRRAPRRPEERVQFARIVDGWASPFARERSDQRLDWARAAWSEEPDFSHAVGRALGRPPEGIWALGMPVGSCDLRRNRVPGKPDWSHLWSGTNDEPKRRGQFDTVQNYLHRLTHGSEGATRLGRQALWACVRYLEHAYLGWCDATLLSLPTSIAATREFMAAEGSLTKRRKRVEAQIRADDPVRSADWIMAEREAIALDQSYLDGARDWESRFEAQIASAGLEFTKKGRARKLFAPNRNSPSMAVDAAATDRRKGTGRNRACLSLGACRALWSVASELQSLSWRTMTHEQRAAKRAEMPPPNRRRSVRSRQYPRPSRPSTQVIPCQGTAGLRLRSGFDLGDAGPRRKLDDVVVELAVLLAWLVWPPPSGGQRLWSSQLDFDDVLSSARPELDDGRL